MAIRPVFCVNENSSEDLVVHEIQVSFDWHPGFSIAQKQRSINSLHSSILSTTSLSRPLEISSKSSLSLGVELSAFNLQLNFRSSRSLKASVETVYQGSKLYSNRARDDDDRYFLQPREARRRARDLECNFKLSGWRIGEYFFDLDSGTEFYSWLYLGALYQQPPLLKQLLQYDCFTDIEFNPKKSLACQARSAALARAVYLSEGDLLPYLKRVAKSRLALKGPIGLNENNQPAGFTSDAQLELEL